MKQIPVFFVHIGNASYLKTVIKQAKKYNENVLLLGDESNKSYCDNWYNIYDYYGKEYERLKKAYRHMSTNTEAFEFSAIAKFLAVYNLARQKNFSQLMLLDSDLMTYVNYSQLNWDGIDAGFSIPEKQEPYIWTISVHCSFWTMNALKDFIDYLLSVYTDEIKLLEEKWNYDQKNKRPGGICDMTLVYLWYKKRQSDMNFYNTALIHDNLVFDHFVYSSEGFRQGDFKVDKVLKMKQIRFKNDTPYFKYRDGKWIKSCTIHAQGVKKIYIDQFYKCSKTMLPYYLLMIRWNMGRIRNKMTHLLKIKD